MYSDGIIGNKMIIETLGNLTAGVYNYMRSTGASAYKLKDIITRAHGYIYPEQNSTESVNSSLLTYVSQAKGFDIKRFKVNE